MRTIVSTGLPEAGGPLEWATMANGMLVTSQAPICSDSSVEDGPMSAQATQTSANLAQTMAAAGGSVEDVTQVLVYLTDKADFAQMSAAYKAVFAKPYPQPRHCHRRSARSIAFINEGLHALRSSWFRRTSVNGHRSMTSSMT